MAGWVLEWARSDSKQCWNELFEVWNFVEFVGCLIWRRALAINLSNNLRAKSDSTRKLPQALANSMAIQSSKHDVSNEEGRWGCLIIHRSSWTVTDSGQWPTAKEAVATIRNRTERWKHWVGNRWQAVTGPWRAVTGPAQGPNNVDFQATNRNWRLQILFNWRVRGYVSGVWRILA